MTQRDIQKKTESKSEVIHILIAEALLNLPNSYRRFRDVELAVSMLGGKRK